MQLVGITLTIDSTINGVIHTREFVIWVKNLSYCEHLVVFSVNTSRRLLVWHSFLTDSG